MGWRNNRRVTLEAVEKQIGRHVAASPPHVTGRPQQEAGRHRAEGDRQGRHHKPGGK